MKLKVIIALSMLALAKQTMAEKINNKEEIDTDTITHKVFKSGPSIQIGTNALGFSYYTKHRAETFGIETTPYIIRTEGGITSNGGSVAIFARKNFHLIANVIVGFGLSGGTEFGKKDNERITKSYEIGPYGILEFEITPQIVFGATVTPVSFSTRSEGHIKTNQWTFIKGGSLQIAYIIN